MEIETKLDFFRNKPFAVRLTDQEIQYISENFDELFDSDHEIKPRPAFMMLVEKTLYKLHKQKESTPQDKELIASLQSDIARLTKENEALNSRIGEISPQFNDLVTIKLNLEEKLLKANEEIAALMALPVGSQEPVEKPLQPTERLLQLTPLESFCLAQVEKVHNCDAKELLINRFFMVYQKRGNGDFDIKRISSG